LTYIKRQQVPQVSALVQTSEWSLMLEQGVIQAGRPLMATDHAPAPIWTIAPLFITAISDTMSGAAPPPEAIAAADRRKPRGHA
jgi:hypothetical protein